MIIKKIFSRFLKAAKKRLAKRKDIYLVYSMGKVGSSTINHSLRKKKPDADIFHVHFLSNNYLDNILPELHKDFHENITVGKNILSFLSQRSRSRKKIITLTREPIERAISDLFQNWTHLYNNIEEIPHEELKAYIESIEHSYTLEWFEKEFKDFLKFDIYEEDFDQTKGYQIYKFKKYDILCIKVEKLTHVSKDAFREFLGEDIPLVESNVSQNKTGKEAYSYLKKHVSINPDKLKEIYSSKYVKHFYSEEEIIGFFNKWSQNSKNKL